MVEFMLTSLVIFVVLSGWLFVQDRYRRFAHRHPELGPFRQEEGCGGGCSCRQGSCHVKPVAPSPIVTVTDFAAQGALRIQQRSKQP